MNHALTLLTALSQATRLGVMRALIAAGPEGLAAGELAERLGVLANTLSAHLTILAQAGLVSHRREGRRVIYAAEMAEMTGLIDYLTRDCCGGRPDLCSPGRCG